MRSCRIAFPLVLLLVLSNTGADGQTPIGTGFTYQGELTNSGSPVSGVYDMMFYLHPDTTGQTTWYAQYLASGVQVVDGRFTTVVDFGGGWYGQIAWWIEIHVKEQGAPTFTVLSPRQRITPTPVAQFAMEGNSGPQGDPGPQGPPGPEGPQGPAGVPWTLNGSDAYYTGGDVGIGTDTPGAELEVRGDIRLGPSGEFEALGAVGSPLRVIAGKLASNGSILFGSGFTTSLSPSSHIYTVTFTTPFPSSNYAVIATVEYVSVVVVSVYTQSSSGVSFRLYNITSAGLEHPFSFVVIGPR